MPQASKKMKHQLDEVDPEVEGGVVPDLDIGRVDGADDEVADDRHKEARSTKPGLTLVSRPVRPPQSRRTAPAPARSG